MARQLSTDRYRQLLACVRALSRLENVEYFHTHATQQLAQLLGQGWVGSDIIAFEPVEFVDGVVWDEVTPAMHEVFAAHLASHPFFAYLQALRQNDLVTIDRIGGEKVFQDCALYEGVYHPLEITHQVSMGHVIGPRHRMVLTFSRDAAYSEAECELIRQLSPHYLNAYQNWQALKSLEREPSWLVEGMETLGDALIIVKGNAKPLRWTKRSEQLVNTYFPGTRRGANELPRTLSRWLKSHLPTDLALFHSPAPLIIPGEGGSVALSIRLLRLAHAEGFLLILEQCRSLPSLEQLKARFGLTPKRAEVLHLLAKGMDNRAIAEQLSISVGTVRKHLELIYRALGVSSRAEAVGKVAQAR